MKLDQRIGRRLDSFVIRKQIQRHEPIPRRANTFDDFTTMLLHSIEFITRQFDACDLAVMSHAKLSEAELSECVFGSFDLLK